MSAVSFSVITAGAPNVRACFLSSELKGTLVCRIIIPSPQDRTYFESALVPVKAS